MTKFEQYLEMIKEMKIEKYEKPSEAYVDLINALGDSSDNMDRSLFDPNELMDAFSYYNFEVDEKRKTATHSSGVKFDIDKVIAIADDIENFYDIDASQLKPAQIKSK